MRKGELTSSSNQRLLRVENARSRAFKENCLDHCPRADARSKLFSAMRSRFALSDGREHPLIPGAMAKRGA
jgi:hypothetical protein